MVATADHSNQPLFSKYRSPTDWPWTLSYVVGEARRILSFFEHLPSEQRPPKSLWHSRQKCADWIDQHKPGEDPDKGKLFFNPNEVER